MSALPSPLPSPLLEEQSGWWPSERSAKSRIKALFTRTKSQDKVVRAQSVDAFPTHPAVQPIQPVSATGDAPGTRRTRSTTWSKGNRTSQRPVRPSRPRNSTSWDPPPLFHAYTQARVHDILDIPSTLGDVLFRGNHAHRSSVSDDDNRSSHSLERLTAPADEAGPHRRHWSAASTGSFRPKLFILTRSGHLLQYAADGLNDRLPEKMLQLGPESVAFACDSIPGKHWVLRVSHDGNLDAMCQAPPHARSKWSFRNGDGKRLVNDLLLVFDNAQSLGFWLRAVRRDIETLGGIEYRPDSPGPGDDDAGRRPGRPLRAQKSLPNISPQLSLGQQFGEEEPGASVLLPPMPQWNATRKISRSTTLSSINTLTELDHIRDASFSDDHSISTSHTSFTGSIASLSYPGDVLSSSLESPRDVAPPPVAPRVSTPTLEDGADTSMFMATPKKATRPVPVRTSSLDHGGFISHDLFVQPNLSHGSQLNLREPPSRPISTIAPLPAPGHIRKTSARNRSEGHDVPPTPKTPASSRPSSVRSRSSSNPKDFSPDSAQKRTASYSLFPKTPSQEQPGPLPDLPSPPATTPGAAYESINANATEGDKDKDYFGRSRASSKSSRPTSRRHGAMPSTDSKSAESTGAISPAQRSPAVTDAHLETCFGTVPEFSRPTLPRKASTTAIHTTTLETGAPSAVSLLPAPKLASPPRKNRQVKSQKSMPALVHRSFPSPGPPPSGPLPALPTEACLPLRTAFDAHKQKLAALSCVPLARPPTKTSPTTGVNKALPAQPEPKPMSPPLDLSSPASKTTASTSTHTRNVSSISSVGSVRHITAWLASPRVATFSAKYELDPMGEMDTEREKEKLTGAPVLNIAVPESPMFSCEFETLIR